MSTDDGWTTVLKKRDKNAAEPKATTTATARSASLSSLPSTKSVTANSAPSIDYASAVIRERAVRAAPPRDEPFHHHVAAAALAKHSAPALMAPGSPPLDAHPVGSPFKPKAATAGVESNVITRPRRQHGSAATGVVKRRDEWQDHCLIEMADGLEDVFCHRHRCQGKALPPAGTRVRFKLHLSSKSLCWQSGFVTWDEADQPHASQQHTDEHHASLSADFAAQPGDDKQRTNGTLFRNADSVVASSSEAMAKQIRRCKEYALLECAAAAAAVGEDRLSKKENLPADGNAADPCFDQLGGLLFASKSSLLPTKPPYCVIPSASSLLAEVGIDEDNTTTASTADASPHQDDDAAAGSREPSEPSADAAAESASLASVPPTWVLDSSSSRTAATHQNLLGSGGGGSRGDDDDLLVDEPCWETERGWADSLMGKILANTQARESWNEGQAAATPGLAARGLLSADSRGGSHPSRAHSTAPVRPPPGLSGPGSATTETASNATLGGLPSSLLSGRWCANQGDDDASALRRDLLLMMGGTADDVAGVGEDDGSDAVVYPRHSAHVSVTGGVDSAEETSLRPSARLHKPLIAEQRDRITLRVVAVDEPKLPWLATAELPVGRAAPLIELRRRIEAAVETGNSSAIQKLKRRRETRKRAKRGDHCRVEVVDRRAGAVRIDAFAVNAAGAGAALRSMLDANVDALRRRSPTGTVDEAEMFANLGWAQLVSQLETILAKCEPDGICCNHLSRAFEKEFGSALVETLFGDFESLAALLRAPQLRGIVELTESPGRPDLTVSLAHARRGRRMPRIDDQPQRRADDSFPAATTPRSYPRGSPRALPLALKPSVSPTAFCTPAAGPHQTHRARSLNSTNFGTTDLFGSSPPQHRTSTLSEPGTLAGLATPPLMPNVTACDSLLTDSRRRLFDPAVLRLEPRRPQPVLVTGAPDDDKRPRSASAPSPSEITRAVGFVALQDRPDLC